MRKVIKRVRNQQFIIKAIGEYLRHNPHELNIKNDGLTEYEVNIGFILEPQRHEGKKLSTIITLKEANPNGTE